jgi:hypothetical protein
MARNWPNYNGHGTGRHGTGQARNWADTELDWHGIGSTESAARKDTPPVKIGHFATTKTCAGKTFFDVPSFAFPLDIFSFLRSGENLFSRPIFFVHKIL